MALLLIKANLLRIGQHPVKLQWRQLVCLLVLLPPICVVMHKPGGFQLAKLLWETMLHLL